MIPQDGRCWHSQWAFQYLPSDPNKYTKLSLNLISYRKDEEHAFVLLLSLTLNINYKYIMTESPNPFCSQADLPEFNLKHLTAHLLVAPDAFRLADLTRCQQLAVLLNLLLKGSPAETVERLNNECLAKWNEVANG